MKPFKLLAPALCWICASAAGGTELVTVSSFPSFGKNAPISYLEASGTKTGSSYRVKLELNYQHSLAPLVAGRVQIAQVLYTDAVQAINNGGDLIIIGIRDAQTPVSTVSLKRTEIVSPADYAGKRWGHAGGFSPEAVLMPKLGERYGFDPNSIRVVNLGFPLRWPSLLNGDVDFISAWWGSGATTLMKTARQSGIPIRVIQWRQHGADYYGEVFVANRAWAASHRDLLKLVMKDLAAAYAQCRTNPTPCIDAVMESKVMHVPDRELVEDGWRQSAELLASDAYNNMFIIDRGKLRRSIEAMALGIALETEAFFTNAYVN